MKQVMNKVIQEFTYDTEEERAKHVEEMITQGWQNSGKVKRMKQDASIWDSSNENNYEWFADFWRYY